MMTLIIVLLLILGYILIATAHLTNVNKAAIAMFMGTVGWVFYICYGTDFVMSQHPHEYIDFLAGEEANSKSVKFFIYDNIFLKYVGKAAAIVMFLLATMSIIEILNNNGCFDFISAWIRTRNSKRLLWTITVATFLISANLDNLTTTMMMLVIMRSIVQNNMEAVLLAPVNRPDLDAEYVAELNGLDIPLVFATARHPGVNAPGVASNLQEGMRLLTSHAVATGGKRVAFLTGSRGVETIDIREESYREVLAQAGLTPEIHRVSEITLENAYRFVLGAKDLPDTLLCLNDMMAVGALNALMERGISVPEQIRVAGFDDGWYARVAVTPLTSVTQDIEAIANASVSAAVSRIHGQAPEQCNTIIPCELRIRKSTQCVRCTQNRP